MKKSEIVRGCLFSLAVVVGLGSCGNSDGVSVGVTGDTGENTGGTMVQNANYRMLIVPPDAEAEKAESDQMKITIDDDSAAQSAASDTFVVSLDEIAIQENRQN